MILTSTPVLAKSEQVNIEGKNFNNNSNNLSAIGSELFFFVVSSRIIVLMLFIQSISPYII